MQKYFGDNWDGPAFDVFGPGHLAAMALIAAIVVFLIWGWRQPKKPQKRLARLLIVSIMLVNEIGWHSWNYFNGVWSIQQNLPLHLCGISIWTTIYMLLSRDYRPYQFVFFFGIVGASQALITPAAGEYGLPHFRAFQTLISHGMLIIALVYLTTKEGLRPTWFSIWMTMVLLNIYLVIVTLINFLLGSNYMFTLRKPDTASLLDVMGPWPWYLLTAEVLAAILFTLLYLPFAIADRRTRMRRE